MCHVNIHPGLYRAEAKDLPVFAALARELWPQAPTEELSSLLDDPAAAVFLLEADGDAIGFAQCQLRRDYVEGTDSSPVGYLEGIYVREAHRRKGYARMLLRACEQWASSQGCTEFASDCELDNLVSQRFHAHVGFTEANRIVCFTKKL